MKQKSFRLQKSDINWHDLFTPITAKKFLISVFLGFASLVAVALFVQLIANLVGANLGASELNETEIGTPLSIVITVLVIPVGEELIFRGVIFTKIMKKYGLLIAYIASMITFALIHANPESIGSLILSLLFGVAGGLVFTHQFYSSKNLFVPIVTHVSFNSLAVIALLNS